MDDTGLCEQLYVKLLGYMLPAWATKGRGRKERARGRREMGSSRYEEKAEIMRGATSLSTATGKESKQ